jgi:polysaccharide deacetylase 2 family uncharacterized protein YibQ
VKAKQKKPRPPARPEARSASKEGGNRKKPRFEDGVRAALIAGAVICAAVLGAGGFFVLRTLFSGGLEQPALSAETPREKSPAGQVPPPVPDAAPAAENGPDILPELDQAIRDLEAAGAAGSGPAGEALEAAGSAPLAQGRGIPPADRRGILVLVIDDAGNNLRELEPFLSFPGPLTIAVLPGLPNSAEAARRVRAAGKELFLHQPMEALNGMNPGPGAVKTGMGPDAVKAALLKNLEEIGPVAGFNNHEGSRATMDPAIMRPLLELSRERGIYFLDSRTIADTAGPAIARELGISIAQRDIFLDNEQDRPSIAAALEAGCKKAEQNGLAVLIGHAWSPHLAAVLAEYYPRLIRQGFYFTTVTGILDPGK